MATSKSEQHTRDIIAAIHRNLKSNGEIQPLKDFDTMYQEACLLLLQRMKVKYNNLQHGECLQVTFRVDIVREDGTVRGGEGYSRDMPEYTEWRDAVYKRDNYTCQDCGARNNLNAHHIKSWAKYPDLRFDVGNGKTVCEDCHAKYHPHLNLFK